MQKGPACRQAGFTPILFLVGILVIIGVAGGAYYFGKSQAPKPQTSSPVVTSSTPQTTPSDETANWKTYTNQILGVTFKYPPDWTIENNGSLFLRASGIEGEMIINFNNSGSKCTDTSHDQVRVQLGDEFLDVCHRYDSERTIESWEKINKFLSNGSSFQIERAWAYSPVDQNRKTILKILSTFKFLEQDAVSSLPDSVELARQDVATKLGVDNSQVITEKLEEIEWRNGSLGCPEEGYVYTQAIIPGYKVIFSYNQSQYEYHTDKGRLFVQCPQK